MESLLLYGIKSGGKELCVICNVIVYILPPEILVEKKFENRLFGVLVFDFEGEI